MEARVRVARSVERLAVGEVAQVQPTVGRADDGALGLRIHCDGMPNGPTGSHRSIAAEPEGSELQVISK